MYTFISKNHFLRLEKNYGICIDKRIEYNLNKLYRIKIEDFFLLTLFNSHFSDEDMIQIINKSKYSADKDGLQWLNYLKDKYFDILESSDNTDERIDSVVLENQYLDLFEKDDLINKLSFPIMASIRIDNYCDSKCIYCFNKSNSLENNYLEYDYIKNLLKQLKKGGVSTLNITGGDPFCHPDILDIIKLIIDYNFTFSISTKRILSNEIINKLSLINLKKIQISIDSINDNVNNFLINKNNYYLQQREAIINIIEKGINVEVNCVINALNINDIESLLIDLNDIGVSKLTLTPYLCTNKTVDEILMTTEKDIEKLDNTLEKYNNLLNIQYELSIPEQNKNFSFYDGEHNMCSGGRMSIVVNYNGDVTICERLVDNKDFVVGNIKNNSIIDIWNSKSLQNITHPIVDLFQGTECENCNEFYECITKNGVCYARINHTTKNKYDCDPFCIKSKIKVRFH